MDAGNLGKIIGVGLIVLIGGAYYLVRRRKANTYNGTAKAVVIRHEHSLTLKPYQTRVVFTYEANGVNREGFTICTTEKAPAVGATLYIQYKTDDPEKYFVP